MTKEIEYIKGTLSPAARYGQPAEEAAELAQAALKMQRYCMEENPPRDHLRQLQANITEEVADVLNAISALDFQPDNQDIIAVRRKKMARWAAHICNVVSRRKEE